MWYVLCLSLIAAQTSAQVLDATANPLAPDQAPSVQLASPLNPASTLTDQQASTRTTRSLIPAAIKPDRHVIYLCAVLAGGNKGKRLAAAQMLAEYRDPAAVSTLNYALNDAEPEVRAAAAQALSACGNRGAVPWLIQALRDPDPAAAESVHAALENLTAHHERLDTSQGLAAQNECQDRWSKWFCRTNWDTIENDLMAHMGTADTTVALQAIEALGHVAGERGRAALRQLVEYQAGADIETRIAAIRELGDLRDAAVLQPLGGLRCCP